MHLIRCALLPSVAAVTHAAVAHAWREPQDTSQEASVSFSGLQALNSSLFSLSSLGGSAVGVSLH